MAGKYNAGQAPQRFVAVDPTTLEDVVPPSAGTPSSPSATRDYGSAAIATSQVSVGTSATQIVPARSGRLAVTITMVGSGDVFVGASGVTVANGSLLLGSKGSSITIPTQAAVFGIGAVAQTVSVLETY